MVDVPVVVLGLGSVGRSFVSQILSQRAFHDRHYGLRLSIRAVGDSQGLVSTGDGGFPDTELAAILKHKAAGRPLTEWAGGSACNSPLAAAQQGTAPGSVVVDCSAADATADALQWALEAGHRIVLANKKPLTQDLAVWDRLTHTPKGTWNLGRSRWETTVGSGLPVVATLHRLVASGDSVTSVEGALSGTLGYVMTGLQEGKAFSEVVTEAKASGYTEPDPRDDLGGVDVARKALILARGMGLGLSLADVEIESLYPEEVADLTVDEFMKALPTLNQGFQSHCAAAARRNACLRYVASVSADAVRVGPQEVPLDSPLGQLQGTDNLVQFRSGWYNPQPLVLQGRGAGVDATAAGVLSDVVDLAFAHP